MKVRIFTLSALLVCLALLLALLPGGATLTAAQGPQPPAPAKSLPGRPLPPDGGPYRAPEGTWYMPAEAVPPAGPSALVSPQATGGPDDFGYGWDDSVAINSLALSAQVSVEPLYQGRFTRAGATEAFQILIRNTGESGPDTYDVTCSSTWTVNLYGPDGTTPLADTDGDGVVDTGPVAQGSIFTVTARVQTPPAANVGSYNFAAITIRSSRDTNESETVRIQTAIPAPFAQVYRDDADGAMSLYLVQPGAQTVHKATEDYYGRGYAMAVAEMPDGNGFVYLWPRYSATGGGVYVAEIFYALFDRYGNIMRGASRLTDNSAATVTTYDRPFAVAVAPNGHIGVAWIRELNNSTSQFNYNIWFAILDSSGNPTYGPVNLTNNDAWGDWDSLNVPRFSSPRIAATRDNRFVLAWQRVHQESAGYVHDIYYTIRSTDGGEVRPVTRFTSDTPGWDEGYYDPGLAQLGGNRVLLAWERGSDGRIYYAVLDSGGNTVKAPTAIVRSGGRRPDAVQLSNGRILVAWAGFGGAGINFAVVDGTTYGVVAGPTPLSNPAAITGDDYVSVAADDAGHAILTWMDADWNSRRNLYYALVDSDGSVITPPMIFRTAGPTTSPYIETSEEGYGNASYRWWARQVFLPLVLKGY